MKRLTPAKYALVLVLLLVLLVTVCVASLHVGKGQARVADAFKELPKSGRERDAIWRAKNIILDIRLPRILLAALIGGALAASGVVFQALLRNPLADPYILGVSGGSALGAVLSIVLGLQSLLGMEATFLSAFAGAAASLALVYSLARVRSGVPTHTLLLAGVIVNSFSGACIIFVLSTVAPTDVKTIMDWLIGSVNTWRILNQGWLGAAALLVAAGFTIVLVYARSLNLFALGERSAEQLGLETRRARFLLLLAASLMTASAVSLCGPIGFVGLIIPHALRLVLGPDHRLLVPASLLFGASFLVGCDAFGRAGFQYIFPAYRLSDFPVGVVTALFGGPFFLLLLRRRQKRATFTQDEA